MPVTAMTAKIGHPKRVFIRMAARKRMNPERVVWNKRKQALAYSRAHVP